MDEGRDDEAVRHFIEQFALTLAESGMARMPGQTSPVCG